MGASDAFVRQVCIRLADDGVGFHYTVKYGGVPVKHGFVPSFHEGGTPGSGHLHALRSGEENAARERDREDHDAG